uniref:Integrase catalytic domain-containing protein n=1 Tax=Solanum lycopersicum TaxID=4081 RepID=A0A3Q7IXB1_SOLLC
MTSGQQQQSGSMTPTDIQAAMHTMSLNPLDPSWYMDTRATSHMTSSSDFQTGKPIMRCDSWGDLYPITTLINNQATCTFAAISPKLWHDRLGYPGAPILDALRHHKNIDCNRLSSSTRKSDVYDTFLVLRNHILTQFERNIKNVQCDNGREFDDGPFWEFCKKHGMSFRLSCPHNSSQNGKAERKIRIINNISRTLLVHASLPPSFWHHSLQMATYLLNILQRKLFDSGLNSYVIQHFTNSIVASNDPPHPAAHSPAQSTPPGSASSQQAQPASLSTEFP